MCTVTYLPLGNNNFILTSNRDETPLRKTISPKIYTENGVEMMYPKDELAGGTWIGLSKKNRLVCLLNGGFENHIKKTSYRMSRGVFVKSLLASDDAVACVVNFDFADIEPFTIVLVDWNTTLKAYELIWDGTKKYFDKLTDEPKIWSSSTLYTDEMKWQRSEWFADWLTENDEFQQQEILKFHQNTNLGTSEISVKMKRENVETVSITSVQKLSEKTKITYIDFVNESEVVLDGGF